MKRHRIRLVNKERFQIFLSVLGLAVMVVAFIAIPKTKSPIERWHEACENGTSWQEYVRSL